METKSLLWKCLFTFSNIFDWFDSTIHLIPQRMLCLYSYVQDVNSFPVSCAGCDIFNCQTRKKAHPTCGNQPTLSHWVRELEKEKFKWRIYFREEKFVQIQFHFQIWTTLPKPPQGVRQGVSLGGSGVEAGRWSRKFFSSESWVFVEMSQVILNCIFFPGRGRIDIFEIVSGFLVSCGFFYWINQRN